jgi:regulator of sigma E protease
MTTLIAFVVLLGILVFVHEFGHFIAAKSVGMKVEKFYLGFNLFGLGIKKQWGETEYGIGLFPLGGYVKVAGVIDESMDDSVKGEPYEFQSKNALQKIWFMSAGVIMNIILAIFIFTMVSWINGNPELIDEPIVGQVQINDENPSPAQKMGMQNGDIIQFVNGVFVSSWTEFAEMIHDMPKTKVEVIFSRDDIIFTKIDTTLSREVMVDGERIQHGMIGIMPTFELVEIPFGEAVYIGFERTWSTWNMVLGSVSDLISGNASMDDVGGPIMIAKIAGETAKSGYLNFILLIAILSVNLALLNILPIPGLDGGHILITLIEAVIRRPLPTKIKIGIQQVGMFLLLSLFVFIMINDIVR